MSWQQRAQASRTHGVAQVKAAAPSWAVLKRDAVAGLSTAVGGVSDGMAASVLVGVSPVHGLYASFAGPIGGGVSTSTRLMVVTTTSAAALAAGSALATVPSAHRLGALYLLTLIAGAVMVAAGLLHLGRYTRFVPHSVMIGFLSGVSMNIIFGQIPQLVGYHAQGSVKLAQAVDTVLHLPSISIPSTVTGLSAIALILVLGHTRVASFSALIALIVPTLVVVLVGADSVATVSDLGAIPTGLPLPHLPHWSDLTVSVITGAFAVAAIVLVQGAGVAESAPNPDRSRSDPNRDFIGEGIGNLASGAFLGQPVGGSVGQTALNVRSGAGGRWASICAGVWMLLILALFAGLVGHVAMPTLAGVLIVAAVGSLRPTQVLIIWRTSAISRVGLVTTFLATLLLPVAAAVGIGVAVALLLQLNQEALDLRIVRLVPSGADSFEEHTAPLELESRTVTVLDIYGSLFYAGARTLQSRLPDPAHAESAAVVLRLRGRTMVGATFMVVVEDYLKRLRAGGGQLFLSGVDPAVAAQMSRVDRFEEPTDIHVLRAELVIGASTRHAYDQAQEWLERQPTPAVD